MKKSKIVLFALLGILLLVAGCGKKNTSADGNVLYYMNSDETSIVKKSYTLKATTLDKKIPELLKALQSNSDSINYQNAIPTTVGVTDTKLTDSQLSIYFDSNYLKMDTKREVLCRAAIVKTMLQLKEVQSVSFYVDGAPLTNQDGTLVGVMTNDTFVENPGKQINNLSKTEITLYFSNKTGDALQAETENLHSSSNTSLEKLIVEHLIEGPTSEGLLGTIPSGTKLISVSLADGICYVNFDEGFLNQNYKIKEEIVIYSIVNSLSELSEVNKVQISVNGNSSMNYRDKLSLNTQFTRDLDYLQPKQ